MVRTPVMRGFQIAMICAAVALAAACSSSNDTHSDAAVDAFNSTCGQPGDTGNELGIGHFCKQFSDCSTTASAPLCSVIGDQTTHFCTKTCTNGGSADQCGTNAACTCNASNQCGCTPMACL
jgi:hypothetical protein